MPYNGEERREIKREDHDLLTRIDANLSNFMSRFQDHTDKDEARFKDVTADIKNTQKYLWMGVGGLGVIVFLLEKVFK